MQAGVIVGRFLPIGLPSRGLGGSTCDMTLSQLDLLHALTVATLPVLHGLESTATVSLGHCASCTGDSSKQLPTSPSPDAGVRHIECTNGGGSRYGPSVSHCGVRTPLGFNIAAPGMLSMHTGAPCPYAMAEAVESLGPPLGRPCGLRTPPRGQHSRASLALCTCWGCMPLRDGRGCGVIRLTSWVVLWIEDWSSMPLRNGRGCGVIGVTSWVALWTEVLCVC